MMYTRWWLHYWRRPAVTPFPRRPDPLAPAHEPTVLQTEPRFRRSLAIRHVDGGSCNGCESELLLLGSPVYDFSRFGFGFTPSPRHADVLLVTGVITEAMVPAIEAAYAAMPAPKLVVAVGECAGGGESCRLWAGMPGVVGDLAKVVPVAARIPGCPPSPNDVLAGLLAVVESPARREA
jgi:membrane-bound hydrogenase subunit mbhJ